MRSCNHRQNCDDREEERANESNLVEDLSDIVSSRSALTDTRNGTALLFQVICNFNGIKGNLCVEVCKCDDKDEQAQGIEPSVRCKELVQTAPEALGAVGDATESKNGGNEGNKRACKDDRPCRS